MTSIIEKRLSLHKHLTNQKEQNAVLMSQVGRLQALANIGTATCMIAHEINNILTPLSNYATMALQNPEDRDLAEKALRKTAQNCQRASRTMESILKMARGEAVEKKTTRLLALVEEIFTCLCRDFSKDGIKVEIRIPEDLTLFAVPALIQQVIMNLILNAKDAMPPRGGVLTITARNAPDIVMIEVADTGCGMNPEDIEKIFEPFYTRKTAARQSSHHSGFGLGLAFCKNAIDGHGGLITVDSNPTVGTVFKITLPKS